MGNVEPYFLKDGSKRYRARYALPSGRRTDKRGFKRKKDAIAFLATVEVDKSTGSFVPYSAGLITVAEMATHWEDTHVGHSESWKARQESIYRVHIKPRWGKWKVKDISPAAVQEWVAEMHQRPRPLAAKTITHILGVLQAILDIAVSERRLVPNPARERIRVPRSPAREKTVLTADQVHALADEVPDQYEDVYWFLVTSGVRFGEAAAVRPRDLLGDGLVRLRRAYAKVDHRSVLTDLKGHELRTVAVPPKVEKRLLARAEDLRQDDLLWTAPRTGGPLRPPESGHWLDAAVKRCHAADETFPVRLPVHSLRHTAASLLISSGANVKVVQRQLGHKSASMTLDQYGHLFEDDLGLVANAMDSMLFGGLGGHGVGTDGDQEEDVA